MEIGFHLPLISLLEWAYEASEQNFSLALPRRWTHVEGAARKVLTFAAVAGPDAELLEAAAVLHDVGYAPHLVDTGLHP